MKNIKNKLLTTIIATLLFAGTMVAFADKATTPKDIKLNTTNTTTTTNKPVSSCQQNCKYIETTSLQIVNNPQAYLGKNVKFKATFDKFSTLGLDYKPAFRDSQKYISFLIKRDDVTDHTIPLSEFKIFIKRTEAEKFIELDSGDIIEVYGNVFSDALTDAWMEAEKIVILEKKNKDKPKKV